MKRIFSICLVLCLCFATIFPITAFAEDMGSTIDGFGSTDDGVADDELAVPEDTGTFLSQEPSGEAYAEPEDMEEEPSQETGSEELLEGLIDAVATFRVIATGENGEVLSGAVFGIYRASDNEWIAEITTDSSGVAEVELPLDDYYLLQTQTAAGYVLPEDRVPFTFAECGDTIVLSVQNQRQPEEPPVNGAVRLIKLEEGTVEPLPGAVFGIYRASDDELVAEITTDNNGVAGCGLAPDDYYLIELAAPEGFILDDSKGDFTVRSGETTELTILNAPVESEPSVTGFVQVIKQAEGTDERLPGAIFGIYKDSNDVKVAEVATDSDGSVVYELLPGSYYLRELKAPEGYALQTDKTGFTVTAKETTEVTVTNKPEEAATGYISLTKKAEGTGDLLPGAVFGIYQASNDVKMAEITTDSNGVAEYELAPGSYYLLELKAPKGYALQKDKTGFAITAGETAELTILNALIDSGASSGGLRLIKKAEGTGDPLSGAVFGIYQASNDAKVAEVTTDSNGVAEYELAPGSYYLRELKAPDGFLAESASIPFTIKGDETVRVEVTDMRNESTAASGGVEIPKTGEDFPVVSYLLSALFTAAAVVCGALLYRKRRQAA